MIINHNIAALNTYRQLSNNNIMGNKSLEKLSSGLRINRAGDDAAGLAISEKMRAQIRGLDQAVRNAQDGISMIQTAEGNLNETHSILQRMRELADQAANDTNVRVDRNEIQKEINQLTTEINRIGNTTEFNTQKLLRGDGTAAVEIGALQLGKTGLADQTTLDGGYIKAATAANLQLSLADGKTADELADEGEITFKFNGNSIKVSFAIVDSSDPKVNTIEVEDAGNEVTINLVADNGNQDFIMSKLQEALEAAIAENENIDASDYTFSRNKAVLSIQTVATGEGQTLSVVGESGQASLTASKDLGDSFDAVKSTDVVATGEAGERKRASAELDSITADKLKAQILATGISELNTDYFVEVDDGGTKTNEVTVDGAIKFLTGKGFTIGDETIEFFNSNEAKYEGDADFAVDLALVGLVGGSDGEFVEDDAKALIAGIADQIGNKMANVTLAANDDGDKLIITAREPGLEANKIEVLDGVDRQATDVVGSTFSASFQIGANQGQSMTITITDMRAEALGIVGVAGKTHNTVDEAAFTEANNVTNGTDNNEYIAALDVSSHEKASAAITVINNAIEKVSAERSKLGAYQNRLEHTINNLGTSSENLTAAESRIRDVDMAKEMMEFTKMSILTQAAQAMLAQANQQPQGVLQLLR